MCKVYRVSNHSLINRRVSRGVADEGSHALSTHPHIQVEIRHMKNYEINSFHVVVGRGVTKITADEVIIIKHQHACYSKGNTIHSSEQVENFKKFVDNRSIKADRKH